MLSSPLIVVSACMLSWSLVLVVCRVILFAYELDPWLFTFIQLMAGGTFLVIYAGYVSGILEALRDPQTWLYGVLRVATAAFFSAALLHTSTANANFLGITAVPITMVMFWVAFSRRPSAWELPGHILIIVGLILLARNLDGGYSNPALLLMILSEVCVVTSTLIAERHGLNQTEDPRMRALLSGVMLLASAFAMLMAAFVLSAIVQWQPALRSALPMNLSWLDHPAQILDTRLWIASVLIGVILRGPTLFLSLKAIHLVGTENYIVGMAILPFASFAFEALALHLGLLPPTPATAPALVFGTVMIIGSLAVFWARTKQTMPARTSMVRRGQHE